MRYFLICSAVLFSGCFLFGHVEFDYVKIYEIRQLNSDDYWIVLKDNPKTTYVWDVCEWVNQDTGVVEWVDTVQKDGRIVRENLVYGGKAVLTHNSQEFYDALVKDGTVLLY